MIFQRFSPAPALAKLIDCYWIARETNPAVRREKIIPDGCTEIIFHKGAPYRICMEGDWQLQSPILFAGQISEHFFLENTGATDIIAIKLKPTAFTHLYGLPAHLFTGKVIDISNAIPDLGSLDAILDTTDDDGNKIKMLNDHFTEHLVKNSSQFTAADKAVEIILAAHGVLQIADICKTVGIGERQLENLFKKQVGLSPKLFARIVRFNYIFQLVQENKQSWCGLAYEAAYYDQSHFIRNFKNFTGESPSDYSFDEKTFANFFLKKNSL